MENTENGANNLLYEEEEKEKDFQMVIPEFGDCGGGDVDISKIGKNKEKGQSSCSQSEASTQSQASMSKKAQKKAAYI